jgi:hypothetical protein
MITHAIFRVLTAACVKIAGFWVISPCILVNVRPEDGGSKYIRNVGKILPDYTAHQPRRQSSSVQVYYMVGLQS